MTTATKTRKAPHARTSTTTIKGFVVCDLKGKPLIEDANVWGPTLFVTTTRKGAAAMLCEEFDMRARQDLDIRRVKIEVMPVE